MRCTCTRFFVESLPTHSASHMHAAADGAMSWLFSGHYCRSSRQVQTTASIGPMHVNSTPTLFGTRPVVTTEQETHTQAANPLPDHLKRGCCIFLPHWAVKTCSQY